MTVPEDPSNSDPLDSMRRANPYPRGKVVLLHGRQAARALCNYLVSMPRGVLSLLWRASAHSIQADLLLSQRLARANPVPSQVVASLVTPVERQELAHAILGKKAAALHPEEGSAELDLLRRANPIPQGVDEQGLGLPAQTLLFSILRSAPVPALPWWRRRIVLIPAACVAVLASAAGYVLAGRPVTEVTNVVCYSAASLSSKSVFEQVTATPTSACDQVWSDGTFSSGGSSSSTAPQLVECVLPSGTLGLFPSTDRSLCTKLGLSPPLPEGKDAAAARELASDLDGAITLQDCYSTSQANALVKAELARLGLYGWSTEVRSSASSARVCAISDVESSTKVVAIIEVPVAPGFSTSTT